MVNFLDFLTPAQRQVFTAVADDQTFLPGAVIMREGDQSRHVMVILKGWAEISSWDGGGGRRVLAERGPGMLIGERGAALLHARSASVTALDMVRVLVMKTTDFTSFLIAHQDVSEFVKKLIDSYPDVESIDVEPLDRHNAVSQAFQERQSAAPGRRLPLNGENCSVLLTDVVDFSGSHRTAQDRRIVRLRTEEMLRAALGPLWDDLVVEDRGDGKLIIAPPAITTASVIGYLHLHLPGELREHNRRSGAPVRIRLRIAVNVGPVTSDAFGLEGDAINRTARLIEAPAFKEAMRSTGANLGIIASTFVYDTAIKDAGESTAATKYKVMRVKVKQYQDIAWLRLFDPVPPRRAIRRGSRPRNPGGPLQDAAR